MTIDHDQQIKFAHPECICPGKETRAKFAIIGCFVMQASFHNYFYAGGGEFGIDNNLAVDRPAGSEGKLVEVVDLSCKSSGNRMIINCVYNLLRSYSYRLSLSLSCFQAESQPHR